MNRSSDTINSIRKSALKRIIYLPHAVRQMSRPDRMISASDVRMAIEQGELVEDYPEDAWGHSCLIPAWVCTQCGEAYFDEAEVEAIQEVLGALDQQSEKLAASG